MRKTVVAVSAGLLLVAGQAAVASNSNLARVGDRIAGAFDESSEIADIPLPVLLIGTAVIVSTVVIASDDDSESQQS